MRKLSLLLLVITIFVGSFSAEVKNEVDVDVLTTSHVIQNSKSTTKKDAFTEALVLVIESVREDIEKNKVEVEKLSLKAKHTAEEKEFLNSLFTKYRVTNNNYKELLTKMIIPPTSLILAQASLESGWGVSGLAQKSNNLFGMKSFSSNEPRIKMGAYYRKYDTIKDSVYDYIINLSRHSAYTALRKGINNGESSIKLTNYLSKYSESSAYKNKLIAMINSNNLTQFDV